MRKTFLALLIPAALVLSANASTFFNDTFSYVNGALTNVSSPLWAAHSGGGSVPVMVSSGTISLVQGAGSREDVNRSTGSTMGAGDIWYAGFDVSVSGGNQTVYFASFLQGTGNFGDRVFVTNTPTGLGDFTFGIGSGANPYSVWSTGLGYGTNFHVVISYEYNTGNGSLWVDPVNISSPSISTTNFINAHTAFAFRQAAGNSVEVIDNLKVATTFDEVLVPEPSTLALTALGGMLCLGCVRGWRKR